VSAVSEPWYAAGLRFACTRCGACCTGSPGVVWIDEFEIEPLARALGIAPDELAHQYLRREGLRLRLYEWPNGDCVLYDPDACSCRAYAARPSQCRTWPFWPANLQNEQKWGQACVVCPGCGQGELVELERIRAWLLTELP
jgi:uncharacterized protein